MAASLSAGFRAAALADTGVPALIDRVLLTPVAVPAAVDACGAILDGLRLVVLLLVVVGVFCVDWRRTWPGAAGFLMLGVADIFSTTHAPLTCTLLT